MTSNRLSTLKSLIAAIACAIVLPHAAVAQNSDGAFQARAGIFGSFGRTHLTSNSVLNDGGSGSTAPFGVGVAGGLEMLKAGAWTMGLEGDLGLTGGGSQTVGAIKVGADYFASLRGRMGLYARPDWVIYGTGGLGFRGVSVTSLAGTNVDKTLVGGVYGLGTEYHMGGTIFFLEYLHQNLGSANFLVGGTSYSTGGHQDSIRLGVKFKLGYDGYYDYVRK